MQEIRDAILSGDRTEETYAGLTIPDTYRAVDGPQGRGRACSRGWPAATRTRAESLHVEDVPTPELGPGEALVAVMASAINYNTVWTSIFEPVSTFGFLERYGRTSQLAKRHDLPYHVVGSDLAGVVLRTGPGVHQVEAGRRGRRALPVGRARGRRRPRRHDARPASSGSGASRRTSAASPSWPSSRPTS